VTTKKRKMKPKEPIPEFKSREEEAEFWDTHDFADYWDEWKPVRVRFAKNLSEGITVRLDPETLAELRIRAHEKGVGPTTLARMWILEHLREERPIPSPGRK
jgi:predicted DNA binding CopG/RHH family protein